MLIPFVYHASYSQLALPDNHRFPTSKYQLLYEYAISQKLLFVEQHHSPTKINIEELYLTHDPQYVDGFINGTLEAKLMRRIGFPWSEALVNRTLYAVNGTKLAVDLAYQHKLAIHLTGGYHHAHQDFGSGFCIFNDLIIAAKHAITHHEADKVLIFDCDVHQGDGTATLSAKYSQIISCSIHCQQNFPSRKQHSTHDIDLPKECNDTDYIQIVENVLPYLINLYKPDLILYDAGVDIHQDDDLGYLSISNQGIFVRDKLVLSLAHKHKIPIVSVIGGGYSKKPELLTQRHSQLLIAANDVFIS